MAVYIVATVNITNPERFKRYLAGVAGLSERFGGETVVRGQVDTVLEGDAPAGLRVIVSRYPDEESAQNYLHSPEYLAAKAERSGAADVTMLLLKD
jgi:uncharacterized protein (DUF1330 family)